MTIRLRSQEKNLNAGQLSALLTQTLLSANVDDAPSSKKAGDGWVMWSDGLERKSAQAN